MPQTVCGGPYAAVSAATGRRGRGRGRPSSMPPGRHSRHPATPMPAPARGSRRIGDHLLLASVDEEHHHFVGERIDDGDGQDEVDHHDAHTKQRCLVRTMRITVETASDSPGPPASADLAVPKVFRNFAGRRKGASRVFRIPPINISRKQQWQN